MAAVTEPDGLGAGPADIIDVRRYELLQDVDDLSRMIDALEDAGVGADQEDTDAMSEAALGMRRLRDKIQERLRRARPDPEKKKSKEPKHGSVGPRKIM